MTFSTKKTIFTVACISMLGSNNFYDLIKCDANQEVILVDMELTTAMSDRLSGISLLGNEY